MSFRSMIAFIWNIPKSIDFLVGGMALICRHYFELLKLTAIRRPHGKRWGGGALPLSQ